MGNNNLIPGHYATMKISSSKKNLMVVKDSMTYSIVGNFGEVFNFGGLTNISKVTKINANLNLMHVCL